MVNLSSNKYSRYNLGLHYHIISEGLQVITPKMVIMEFVSSLCHVQKVLEEQVCNFIIYILMMEEIKKEAYFESVEACKIVPAMLGENIGDIAALSLALLSNQSEI